VGDICRAVKVPDTLALEDEQMTTDYWDCEAGNWMGAHEALIKFVESDSKGEDMYHIQLLVGPRDDLMCTYLGGWEIFEECEVNERRLHPTT